MTEVPPVPDRARIRLKPKANLRAIRRGAPWIFGNELVLDRRTRSLPSGSLAVLEDDDRAPVALVAVNTGSKIAARVLDRDVSATIDAAWFRRRLDRAVRLRSLLYDTPFYRLVHAEADGLPGIVIDRFGDICVIQPNAAWAEAQITALVDALTDVTKCVTVLKNASGRGRVLEGLDARAAVLRGTEPAGPVDVSMNRAIYLADLTGGQKTGLFYDQRENHAFAARLAPDRSVLDVFSHVGGFGLAALAAGAMHVRAVDSSEPALNLARLGAEKMGRRARFETVQADAFDALADDSDRYDMVICDPPAFAPSKPALEKGLRAYERIARLAAARVAEGGDLVLCSCSHAVEPARFMGACLRGIGRAGRRAQLVHTGQAGPDHPTLPQLAESGYLKALFFRL